VKNLLLFYSFYKETKKEKKKPEKKALPLHGVQVKTNTHAEFLTMLC